MELGPNQEKVLQALESGKYIQGKGGLVTQNIDGTIGYCCLGVFCEELVPEARQDHVYLNKSYSGYYNEYIVCPLEVVEILKLRDTLGSPESGIDEYKLWQLNDNGRSHKEIAQIIRANPSNYFTEPA